MKYYLGDSPKLVLKFKESENFTLSGISASLEKPNGSYELDSQQIVKKAESLQFIIPSEVLNMPGNYILWASLGLGDGSTKSHPIHFQMLARSTPLNVYTVPVPVPVLGTVPSVHSMYTGQDLSSLTDSELRDLVGEFELQEKPIFEKAEVMRARSWEGIDPSAMTDSELLNLHAELEVI